MSSAALTHPTFSHLSHLDLQNPSTLYLSFIHANVFEVYVFGIMPVLSHSDQSAVPEDGGGTEQWAGGVTQPTQVAFQMANPRLNLDLSLAHVFIIQFIIVSSVCLSGF